MAGGGGTAAFILRGSTFPVRNMPEGVTVHALDFVQNPQIGFQAAFGMTSAAFHSFSKTWIKSGINVTFSFSSTRIWSARSPVKATRLGGLDN